MTRRILYVLLILLLGLLSLLLGLLLQPGTAGAQAPCDAGYVLEVQTPLSTAPASRTVAAAGYVLISADGLYRYSVNGGPGLQRTTDVRIGLSAGATISYQLLTATTGTATHCTAPVPTSAAYPAPGTPTAGVPSATPTSAAYPVPSTPTAGILPSPLPTIIPDQTLELLATQGQAITETASGKAGLAIIASLLLWVGLRMLVLRTPWR
jgi:hypothetical protein